MADRVWVHLLTIAGGRAAVWQSPTRRYFASTPETTAIAGWTGPRQHLHAHGFSRLPEAIRAAAEHEAELRARKTPSLQLVRTVLWETEPTPSYIAAEHRVHSAMQLALTLLRGAGQSTGGPR